MSILKGLLVTEKTQVLQGLCENESNRCVKAFKKAKYVFLVDVAANKHQIRQELEALFSAQGIKIEKVNTVMQRGKTKRPRNRRFQAGVTARKKKAIVTLKEGQELNFEM